MYNIFTIRFWVFFLFRTFFYIIGRRNISINEYDETVQQIIITMHNISVIIIYNNSLAVTWARARVQFETRRKFHVRKNYWKSVLTEMMIFFQLNTVKFSCWNKKNAKLKFGGHFFFFGKYKIMQLVIARPGVCVLLW